MSEPSPTTAPQATANPILDREESWLRFNERVLEEAMDPSTPLLERLRFLTIFHTNLDEFFMIRVSGLKQQIEAGIAVLSTDGRSPSQHLAKIRKEALDMVSLAADTLGHLLAALSEHGIQIIGYRQMPDDQQARWSRTYQEKVRPILIPLAISPAFPFPFISNLSLNLAVHVRSKGGEQRLVRIKIPDHLPRLVVVEAGADPSEPPVRYMPIEEVIAANLDTLFPGMEVGRPYVFRVTRDADIEISTDEAQDLLVFIEEEVRKRRFGKAVRLEVQADTPEDIVRQLQTGLDVQDLDIYRVEHMVDATGLSRMISLDVPELKFPPFAPRVGRKLEGDKLFARIAAGDVLLHHPFDAFTPVAEFIRQAARDPNVLAIKQTLYRTSGDSPVISALLEAVENGKQVAAVVELKARFDEENNIVWARRLEEAGVHVIYGVPGLKTHAKLSLVVRQEGGRLRHYGHIGTGNYNPVTARVYTDLGLFTCDPAITADLADLFNRITGFAEPPGYRKALIAPRFMKCALIDHIKHEAEAARDGRPARIILKCNAIIDHDVINALYDASCAGARVDLLVRGICGVVPGVHGLSENIQVRSVVGRFLEHSRLYWFHRDGDPAVYIGSADLMGRNLDRRVEILIPIEDKKIRTWLFEVYLARYLDDRGRTRLMQPDGTYQRLRDTEGSTPDVHQQFLAEVMTQS